MKDVRCDMCGCPMIDGDYSTDMNVETKDGREHNIHLAVIQIGISNNKLDICPDCSVSLLQESLKTD